MLSRTAALLCLLAAPAAFMQAPPTTVKVACVGDSITFGSGAQPRETANYPAVLQTLLGEEYVVKNFGVSGATMLRTGDKPYSKQKAYTQALEFKPDIVVIKLGTNDTKPQNWSKNDDYAPSAKALVAAFRSANPQVKLFLCLPVPAFPGNFGIRDEVIRDEVCPLVKKVAAEENARVIDLYATLTGKSNLVPDKVHPNAAGYRLIAGAVYTALTGKTADLDKLPAPVAPPPKKSATVK